MEERFTKRQVKKIEKVRKGNSGKGWSIVAIVFGAACFIDLTQMRPYDAAFNVVIGAALLCLGIGHIVRAKSKARRWDNLDGNINHKGNTPISYLAKATGYPTDKIRVDLQEMIRNHFFIGEYQDTEAYLDGELDMLIMTMYPSGMPFVPVGDTINKVKMEQEKKKQIPEILAIRKAIGKITDEDVKTALYDLEGSVRRIEDHLIEKPELREKASVKKLKEYYLPQVISLVDKYEKGSVSEETMSEIKQVIGTCAEAFQNMEKNLLEKDDLDTMVDIDVLKNTLSREGLLGSDFSVE